MLTFEKSTRWADEAASSPIVSEPELGVAPVPTVARSSWGFWDFSLVALVVVLAATAAFFSIRQSIHRTTCKTLASDLVAQAEAFRRYAAEHDGATPDASEPGLPPGMATYTAEAKWTEPTPLGGHFRWLSATEKRSDGKPRYLGGVAITAFSPSPSLRLTSADLLAIDELIDDGNLATGRFRTGFNGWPVYWVNAEP